MPQKGGSKKKVGTVLLSSVTDPYQPVERKFKATRSLLEILRDHPFPVEILTKSSLVQRDLDVISEIDEAEIGLTVTFWNDETRRVFEPGASPTQERIETLALFSDAGIPTYAFLGPLIPYLGEEDMDMLLNSLANKVNRVLVDRLNIKAGNWGRIKETLERHYPDQLSAIQEASKEPSSYYDSLRSKIKLEIGRRAIPADILF